MGEWAVKVGDRVKWNHAGGWLEENEVTTIIALGGEYPDQIAILKKDDGRLSRFPYDVTGCCCFDLVEENNG